MRENRVWFYFGKKARFQKRKKAKKLRRDNQQQSVVSGFASMNAADFEKTKKKFDVAYFLAKEELPLAKFEEIIDLEKRHDVDLGTAYCNQMEANSFIDSISDDLGSELKQKISVVKCLSVLTDGSTDASNVEKEAVFVRFLDKNPLNSNDVKVFHNFVGLSDLDTGKAAGVVTAIENSFRDVHAYDEFTEKIVAFGADGENVNQGEDGAIAILRWTFGLWIAFIWCVTSTEGSSPRYVIWWYGRTIITNLLLVWKIPQKASRAAINTRQV